MKKIPLFLGICLGIPFLFSPPATAQKDKKKKNADPQIAAFQRQRAEDIFAVAEKYYILEDYAKALAYFQTAQEHNPDNATVYYKIAEVLSKSKKAEDHQLALLNLERAIQLDKTNRYFYLLASNLYNETGNFQKSAQMMEAMMKEVKGTEEYLYELAAIYQYDKKPDDAIRIYNKAEGILGVSEVSSLEKMKLYFSLGKINEGIAEGDKLLGAFPDEERYAMAYAEMLSQKNQRKKAIEKLEQYILSHPEAGPSMILLSGLYHDDIQESKSRELLLKAFDKPEVDINSKILVVGTYNAQIGQALARNQRDAGMEDFAVRLLEKLRQQHDADPNVHLVGGDLMMTLRRMGEAQKEYSTAIRRGATAFEAWQNLLSIESETNQIDSLIAHSEHGMELFPNQAALYYFNGYGHLRKNHYKDASRSLEQAKKLSSGNAAFVADINSMLGDAYNGTKEYEKSDRAYEDALNFNPDNNYVLNNYSYYLSLRKVNLEKAERMAEKAARQQPDNTSFLDTYAWVLFMREKYRDARKVMEKALQQPTNSSTLYEHYGDILFQLGEVDAAVRQWEKARSLTSQHEQIDRKIANRRLY